MAPKAEAGKRPSPKAPKASEAGARYTRSKSTRISKGEIESVAGKLAEFAKELPQQERDVLGWILTRAQAAPASELAAAAAAATPQVPSLKTPLATQLARSVGFGVGNAAKPEITVIVGWQYRFGFENPGEVLVNPAKK
jgi:hypothetical protein